IRKTGVCWDPGLIRVEYLDEEGTPYYCEFERRAEPERMPPAEESPKPAVSPSSPGSLPVRPRRHRAAPGPGMPRFRFAAQGGLTMTSQLMITAPSRTPERQPLVQRLLVAFAALALLAARAKAEPDPKEVDTFTAGGKSIRVERFTPKARGKHPAVL